MSAGCRIPFADNSWLSAVHESSSDFDPLGAGAGFHLDAESGYRVDPGFSGGGLWCLDDEAVIAIFGQANERGDGRAITLHQTIARFPDQHLNQLSERFDATLASDIALSACALHDALGERTGPRFNVIIDAFDEASEAGDSSWGRKPGCWRFGSTSASKVLSVNADGPIHPAEDSWVVALHSSATGSGSRRGAGVAIDGRRVLTRAHAVLRGDVDRRTRRPDSRSRIRRPRARRWVGQVSYTVTANWTNTGRDGRDATAREPAGT